MKAIVIGLILGVASAWAGPGLEFLEPAPGAVFFQGTEVPLVLLGEVPGEIVAGAEVFVDGQSIGVAVYCCRFCPCAAPMEGMALVLQLPSPEEEFPGGRPWQGLTGLAPGIHRLTARTVAGGGTEIIASERVIRVLPITEEDLHLIVSDGPGGTLAFVLPYGSLIPGGFDMWLSHDLVGWSRIGAFIPGNVAAFFGDDPDPEDHRPRFYRAIQNGN